MYCFSTFKILNQFEFTFVYGVKKCAHFTLSCVASSFLSTACLILHCSFASFVMD